MVCCSLKFNCLLHICLFGFEYYDMRHSVKRRAEEGNFTEKEMNRRIEGLDRERAKYYKLLQQPEMGRTGQLRPDDQYIGKGYQAGICRAGAVFEGAALLMENGRKQEDWSPPWRISACLRC